MWQPVTSPDDVTAQRVTRPRVFSDRYPLLSGRRDRLPPEDTGAFPRLPLGEFPTMAHHSKDGRTWNVEGWRNRVVSAAIHLSASWDVPVSIQDASAGPTATDRAERELEYALANYTAALLGGSVPDPLTDPPVFEGSQPPPVIQRAPEMDTLSRSADDAGVLGLLMLRQAAFTGSPGHPHADVFRMARDNAFAEALWRMSRAAVAVRCADA